MKKSKGKRRFDRMESILLVFSGAILLIAAVICVAVYLFCMRLVTDQTISMQSSLAANACTEIRNTLQELDSYLLQNLGKCSAATSFLTAPKEPSNQRTIYIRSLQLSFPAFSDSRGILSDTEDIWVYSRINGCITNNITSFSSVEDFTSFMKIEPSNLLPDESNDYSESYSFHAVRIASQQQILYVRKLFSNFSCTGKAFCILNANQLLSVLGQYSLPNLPSETVIYTRDSEAVYSTLEQEVSGILISSDFSSGNSHYQTLSLSGTDYIAFQTKMDGYDFSVISLIPKTYFSNYALQSSLSVLRTMLPIVLAGFVLLMGLLMYNHRFLSDILHIFDSNRKEAATSNPYKYLRQSVTQLNRTKEEQRFLLENSYNEMREATLTGLVYRPGERIENLQEKLAEYGILLDADILCGLILSLSSEDGSPIQVTDREHMCIVDIIAEQTSEIQYIKMDGPCRMLMVARLDDTPDHTGELSDRLYRICSAVAQTIHCRVFICAGREVRKIEDLVWSFKTARDMLPSLQDGGTPVYLCRKSSPEKALYSYTNQDSHELAEAASASDPETLQAKLDEIREKNEPMLQTPFERQMLYTHMLSALIKAGYTGDFDEEILLHLSDIPTRVFFQKLAGYYQNLCSANQAQKKKQQEQMIQDVLESIRAHLADYSFTISDLSSEFGISERQMQQKIVSQTGMSFSAWLEHCRIEKANELLQNPDIKITEIAEMTGYASDKSFRRAFKRVTGFAPSQKRSE